MLDGIGDGECGDGTAEDDGAVQEVGNHVSTQHDFQSFAEGVSQAETHHDGDKKADNGGADGFRGAAGEDGLEDKHGEHRADGVDDDAFPFGNRPDAFSWPDMAEKRDDDGWTCDGEDGSEQEGDSDVEMKKVVSRDGGEHPGYEDTDGAESDHGSAGFLEFLEPERESAFEEDDANGEGHRGKEQITGDEVIGGEEKAGENAEYEEHENGW